MGFEARTGERHEVTADTAAEIEHAPGAALPQKSNHGQDLRVRHQPFAAVRLVAPALIQAWWAVAVPRLTSAMARGPTPQMIRLRARTLSRSTASTRAKIARMMVAARSY